MLVPALMGALLMAGAARAQDGFDAHGFQLAAQDGDPRDPLTVERPGRFSQGDGAFGALVEYADRPLVLVTEPASAGETGEGDVAPALDDLWALDLTGSVAVLDKLRLDLFAPIYFTSQGTGGPQGAGLGDLRLGAMAAFLQPGDLGGAAGLGLGLVPYVVLPSGDDSEFLGQSGMSGGLRLASTLEVGKLTLGGDLGMQWNPAIDIENLTGSDQLLAGLGASWLLDVDSSIGAELRAAPALEANTIRGTGSPSEVLLQGRHRRDSGAYYVLGGGFGVSPGAGAAAYRLFLGGGWGSASESLTDRDADGLVDNVDDCPDDPETRNAYKDDDGCPDALAGVTIKATVDGVPADGVLVAMKGPGGDSRSVTTTTAGSELEVIPGAWSFTGTKGELVSYPLLKEIPEGATTVTVVLGKGTLVFKVTSMSGAPLPAEVLIMGSDGVAPVTATLGPDGTGNQRVNPGKYQVTITAPEYGLVKVDVEVPPGESKEIVVSLDAAKVKVAETKIEIIEKVFFEYDKAIIKPESYRLLDEVAGQIQRHADVLKLEIGGHTDDEGGDAYNRRLSDDRAKAVRTYLIQCGVAPDRLVSVGYGESKPIASNATESGRAENRRVEFVILEKTKAGGAP